MTGDDQKMNYELLQLAIRKRFCCKYVQPDPLKTSNIINELSVGRNRRLLYPHRNVMVLHWLSCYRLKCVRYLHPCLRLPPTRQSSKNGLNAGAFLTRLLHVEYFICSEKSAHEKIIQRSCLMISSSCSRIMSHLEDVRIVTLVSALAEPSVADFSLIELTNQ